MVTRSRCLSLGVSETVKFVTRYTKHCDLLRIFNLARTLSYEDSERAENHISDQVWHSGAESGLSVWATNLTVLDILRDTFFYFNKSPHRSFTGGEKGGRAKRYKECAGAKTRETTMLNTMDESLI